MKNFFTKNLFTFLFAVMMVMVLVPVVTSAQATGERCSDGATPDGTLCNALPSFGGVSVGNLRELVVAVLFWGGSLIATGALIMIIYAGARMIIGQGDPAAVTEAKSTMFYSIAGFILASMSYVVVSSLEFFLGVNPDQPDNSFFFNPLQSDTLLGLVSSSISGFLAIAGAIAMLYIIIGGFRYITAGGNEDQVKKAKGTVTWAIMGLISIILSYTIIRVLQVTMTAQ